VLATFDISKMFTESSALVTNPTAVLVFDNGLDGPQTRSNLSSPDTEIGPGDSSIFTGIGVAPVFPARDPSETSDQYLGDLGFLLGFTTFRATVLANASGEVRTPDQASGAQYPIPWQYPLIRPAKSGPTQAIAGLTLPYPVSIQNQGTSVASALVTTDTVNGADIGAGITGPTTLNGGATATIILNAASPLGQAPGPYTDTVHITWQDRNGNLYGPVDSSFTTNILAGHPEGYLTLTGTAPGAPQIIGSPLTLTVTALDGLGNPAPNLAVQLSIAGVNGQTVPLVTGADGTAAFSYDGPNLGRDSISVTATINGPTLTASIPSFVWASTAPQQQPCQGRDTPLDVMLVLDGSPSMFTDDQIDAANAATNAFLGDLDPGLDQAGSIVFSGFVPLSAPLSSDLATVQSETDAAFSAQVHACDGFCPGGSDFLDAFAVALAELQGPRHRPGASPLIVFLSDGGNTGDDPTAEIAAVKAAGVRVIALGYGSNVNVAEMRGMVASSPNDYFYAPSVNELGWIYGNIDQDACRTVPPIVSAGGSQGLYEVRLPSVLTLQGEVHGGGPRGDVNLTSTWTEVSGPAPVSFADASSPVTDVLFTDPGTYVLQLEATDGFLTTADRATITVDPAQSLTGAGLSVSLSSAGPLIVGSAEAVTATLTDASSTPISNFVVQFAVSGANPTAGTVTTNASGLATFAYTGAAPGTDILQVTAIGGTAQLAATPLSISWTPAPPGSGSGGIVTQGWIGSPAGRATIRGRVPVTVAGGVTVASATVSYWPANAPGNATVIATNATGGSGATLAVFDTTVLPNGSYVLDVNGTDDHGTQQDNEILVAVAGEYKPGREVVDVTDYTFPIARMPITIGRRYDSLNKDKVGDFGNGWALTIGHPDLQVDQANDVTITMPDGRRSTFIFEIQPAVAGPIVLGFIGTPLYVPEPGVFGTLTSDGCGVLTFDPNNPAPICFDSIFDPQTLQYAPTTYVYTDPYGTAYTMGADGTLKTIQDRNQNTLTFTSDGIAGTNGQTVTISRDDLGRITKVVSPSLGDVFNGHIEYDYVYDANGNLSTVTRPPVSSITNNWTYTYDGVHRLLTSTDPLGNHARTSTFDDAGRLVTDTDALGNLTKYAYDLASHTTTTTYPDTGVVTEKFDDRGLLLSQTDALGRITTHVYDPNQNEVKRTNAVGESTTSTYDANGNKTSNINALGEATTATYNVFSEPLTTTNPIGNTVTTTYDDSGVPTSYVDSLGPLATLTSSEHGLPTSASDAMGNTVYLNYDAAGDLTSRTDRLGRTTTHAYDGFGRHTSMTTPRGATWTYGYDGRGDRIATDDPINGIFGIHRTNDDENGNLVGDYFQFFGHSFTFFYDPLNHLTDKWNADGTTVRYTRDFRGNVLTQIDEGGHTTSYVYDLAGQLVQTTNPDGTTIKRTYDSLGRLASKTDERGNTTAYAYEPGCDCSERLTSVTDPLGRTMSMTYDGMGRKTSMTDASGHQTSYTYDLRGHLVETDYADGTAVRDTFDALGRRITSRDQTGAVTQFGYDAEGQLVSVTDPLNNVTQYAYDADGNLAEVTDANGRTTVYAYDLMEEKTSRTLPLGMTETFTYNPTGDQITHTDFRGKTTNVAFDQLHRVQSKTPDPSLGEPAIAYAYNDSGTRSAMTDASGASSYTYDTRNRLLTKATPEGTLTYTYDASGNVASIDSSNTNGTSVSYAWDAANQLVSVTDNRLGGATTAAYTATGRPFTLSQPNGVGVTYGYDSLDRVKSMDWQTGAPTTLASWAYTYSARGQRLSATDVSGREAAYGYDAASRFTSEAVTGNPSGNGALTYVLDPAGNRQSRASTLAALGVQSFLYDPNDELTRDVYDLNGNTTSSGGHTFAYDFENRLVSKDGDTVTLVYDGDGNRVAKTVGGVTTQYLVDAQNPTGYLQVIEEVSGGAAQVRYVYGSRIISQTRDISTTPGTRYFGYDAHGNVTFLTDVGGSVTDSYEYDGWGNIVARTGSTQTTRLYAGEELDPDLGLINLRARQYSAGTGRFYTIDPLDRVPSVRPQVTMRGDAIGGVTKSFFDNRGSLNGNRFGYANADPINGMDPTGRDDAEEEAEDYASGVAKGLAIINLHVHAFELFLPHSEEGEEQMAHNEYCGAVLDGADIFLAAAGMGVASLVLGLVDVTCWLMAETGHL
jgi:RHS repeat-associated protein